MKKILIIAILTFVTNSVFSQKVKLKDHKVLIDGKEVFGYKKDETTTTTLTIFDLNTKEELIFIKEDNGGTRDTRDDDFTIYNFLREKVKVEISYYDFMSSNVKFLFVNGIFDTNGKLNEQKILTFKEKFDEKISEKTIITR